VSGSLLQDYLLCDEFQQASALLDSGSARLGGFWGGSFSFFLGGWHGARREGAGRCVLVTSCQEDADQLLEELEAFVPGSVAAFPAWDSLFLDSSSPDPLVYGERLRALEQLLEPEAGPVFIVTPVHALVQPVPQPDLLQATCVELVQGRELSPAELATTLTAKGYRNVPLAEEVGEYSSRGDIFDVFPFSHESPLRLEYFGDQVESIRRYDPATQRSLPESVEERVELVLATGDEVFRDCYRGEEALLLDYLQESDRVVLWEADAVFARASKVFNNLLGTAGDAVRDQFLLRLRGRAGVHASCMPVASDSVPARTLGFGSVEQMRSTDISRAFDSLRSRISSQIEVTVYCESEGEAKRFGELLRDNQLGGEKGITIEIGGLRRGFEITALSRAVLTTRELFNRQVVRRARRTKAASGKAIRSFLELRKGDYVVHLVHGIGRYMGIEALEKDGVEQEFLALVYKGDVKVYVPVSKIDLVQKYIGSGDRVPKLDKVGGTSWVRKKDEVEAALMDLAAELLDVQAARLEHPGIAYEEDSEWQRQFEAAFPFDDTADQVEVTAAIKEDMQQPRPMDRLVCGDVGYGKTELAMRAAFKAVEGGRQVAILVPTTLLAQQHYRSFCDRMAGFPVTIEVLSRFRSRPQQQETVERARQGQADILIGTHRLLSADVGFRDLGLVVIDEEQRFGVVHKEKLKRLRSEVEVLTLSATPIPRTLHMALLGLRDISSLSTAPEGRMAIQTELSHFDANRMREIIVRELNRDGQVYLVHNRVMDIEVLKKQVQETVPEARVLVVHGQLNERELESRMSAFMRHEADVLLATTIIESGIDIPRVNTIIINEADRYGLADLHQLRGRVGRYKHQAYCYLFLPERRHVSPEALKRLQALVEYSGLGSGFQIAMRDLEIRGAGNILGKQQSGHIATIGYDLYCRLLEKCVHSMKDQHYQEPVTVEIDLALQAHIPDDFIRSEEIKLEVYRKISTAQSREALADLAEEVRDCHGELPPQVDQLLGLQQLRLDCTAWEIEYVGCEEGNLILRGGEKLKGLLDGCPCRISVLDPATVAISLRKEGLPGQGQKPGKHLFSLVAQWMETGKFPESRRLRRRFVDISK